MIYTREEIETQKMTGEFKSTDVEDIYWSDECTEEGYVVIYVSDGVYAQYGDVITASGEYKDGGDIIESRHYGKKTTWERAL